MFAHGFYSKVKAIGATSDATSAFTSLRNLDDPEDQLKLGEDARGHSRQYISNYLRVSRYWDYVKESAGF
jgi:hypothetical protein